MITEVNGQKVTNASMLASYVAVLRIGTPLTLKIYRNGKPMVIHAKVGKKPNTTGTANGTMNSSVPIGATFANITQSSPLYGQVQGVIVTQVQPGEAADEAGLQPGDVITAIDRRPIHNLAQFNEALGVYKGKTVLLTVRRGNNVFFTTIHLP